MYSHFKGKIEEILKEKVVIDVNDVGYEIYLPESDISNLKINEKVKIYTYLHVREDDMKLFGFLSKENLSFFKKLISVSGVGPKVGLGIIANITPHDMCVAIATDNILTLKAIPGIGPKMAQKIIFELKDKILKEDIDNIGSKSSKKNLNNTHVSEAITALQVLGYSQSEIKEVISKLEVENDTVENVIKKVLKEMQKI